MSHALNSNITLNWLEKVIYLLCKVKKLPKLNCILWPKCKIFFSFLLIYIFKHWQTKGPSTRTFLHPILRPICMQIGSPSDSLSDFSSDTNLPISPKLCTTFFGGSIKCRETHTARATEQHQIGCGIGCKIGCVCVDARFSCRTENVSVTDLHGWNMSWSKLSVLACLECVMVKIVCFSMPGIWYDHNHQFQQVWNVSLLKSSVSAWLEWFIVQIVNFSMAGICLAEKCQFQHG
jgi:hypothetical protein